MTYIYSKYIPNLVKKYNIYKNLKHYFLLFQTSISMKSYLFLTGNIDLFNFNNLNGGVKNR